MSSPPAAGLVLAAADRIDRVVALVCRFVILATMIILLAVLGANVVARYALATGAFSWSLEIPELLFPWMIAAGVALATQQGAHIAVDILPAALGRGGKLVLLVAINLLVAATYIVLAVVMTQLAGVAAIEQTPIFGLSRRYGFDALTFGAVLTSLSCLIIAARVLLVGPEAAPQPNPEESVT